MSFNWKYVKLNNVIQVNHGNARQNNIGGSYIKRITENNIGGSYNTRITENNNEWWWTNIRKIQVSAFKIVIAIDNVPLDEEDVETAFNELFTSKRWLIS